uniref:non-specific serine/threonine protein kinase n=1 Tax=Poecilia mexicana TaxID=48701 RepID=A0A3B3XEK7_9TELE
MSFILSQLYIFLFQTGKSWIEESFFRRECVKFIPSSWDQHRCCCGRLMGEHSWQESCPPISLCPSPEQGMEEWSMEAHTKASSTNAYGIIDFQDTATRVCRAKYVRVAVDSKPEALLQLMLREWQMERPKLLLTVHGGSENFILPPKVNQAFSKGLITAAISTGAWIFTDGINTGVSKYVGEAVKLFGGHDLRKRNTIGITSWGMIDNNLDLIGRDVFRPYQPLGNPLSKRTCLNGFHSHFLLVDDGTLGKPGCQQGLRRKLEKQIQLLKIHPRLNQGVPVLCVVVEGSAAIVSTVLDYVSSAPPVPVFVFEGSGKAADLFAFLHKQTANDRCVGNVYFKWEAMIGDVFGVERTEAAHLYTLLQQCMDHRESITIFDSEADEQMATDAAILTAVLKGTKASPSEQLSMALAWDRADIAQKDILVYGQHWQVGSLEQAMLDSLVMDRVSFVKLLIDNGMTMSRFLTVDRLEELYNSPQGQTQRFLQHLVEDAKQTSLPTGYRLSLIDMGLVIEYLIGGAYRSSYTRKNFRAAYNLYEIFKKKNVIYLQDSRRFSSGSFTNQSRGMSLKKSRSLQDLHFFRTAQPYKSKVVLTHGLCGTTLLPCPFNSNDLFVWAVLQQRQQMALFLWQHGEEALARAIVGCKLYRSMAFEVRQSNMDDNVAERFQSYSLEFGQLAVDVLDCAFQQNEQMAMKLLTSEMEAWSHFTCLQLAVSSCHRPFVSHSCTQTLLTDLWTGPLNMRKNSFMKIILSLLLPPAILLLEFKSKAEMCHVPQSHEAMLFGLESVKSLPIPEGSVQMMSYLIFLMLFSFVVLVKMEDQPSVQEWFVILYIVSSAIEKTREVLMSEPRKLRQKLKVWFSEYWNKSDFVAILLFLVGLSMRCHADPFRTAGRVAYCLDIIFWFIRVLDLLAVNQHAGPYLTMITKMTSNMFFIVVMMAIVLLSFGVSRQAILSPDHEPSWSLARDIVFQPYWMIFGEVYAGELESCGDDPCPPAFFLSPLLQAVYMFVQYIIMVNILIAFFNNIYFEMASISNKLWKYNRYRYIRTYQERPWLPPPLILLSHVALAVRSIYRRFSGDAEQEERRSGLKLYLGLEDRKRLYEFEEKCVELYLHKKNEDLHSTSINRIRATAERADEMCGTVGEVSEKVILIQDSLSELDGQLGQLQDLSVLAVDTLTLLSASDSLQQEEARLAQCRHVLPASRHVLPHSWTLPHRGAEDCDVSNVRRLEIKACKSTPPSLLKGSAVEGSRRASQDRHAGVRENRAGKKGLPEAGEETDSRSVPVEDPSENWFRGPGRGSHVSSSQCNLGGGRTKTPSETPESSCCGSPISPKPFGTAHSKAWTHLYPSQEEASVEEGEEDAEREEKEEEDVPNLEVFVAYSNCLTVSDSDNDDVSPDFSQDESQPSFPSRHSSHWRKPPLPTRWASMERNNLMRLAHSIPFTPVSILGGEEVSVYFLEEVCSKAEPESSSVSSWSSRVQSAMLKPLSSEEGSLDGGLRQGSRMLCTWAQQDVLQPGQIYVVKAFKPEVIRAWQRYFHGSTALQLCLREIQQQRAAQKMMQVFNQIKPKDMHHSPRFLDVSLVLRHSNGQWLTIERNLIGNFRKYNNNTGEEIAPCCSLEDMLLAFSHWTYEYSRREMLVLDIQGVGEELTDPTVIMADDQSRGEVLFGPDNLGDAAINGFLQKHSCNLCCHRLGLKDLRRRPGSGGNSSETEERWRR